MDARADAMIKSPPGPLARTRMSIYEQVLTFIHRPEDKSFERIALEVFRHQFETVGAYRRYCDRRGVVPDSVHSVEEIPAVSNVAFKYAELAAEGVAQSPDAAIFLTSGTTQGRERRGRHVVARSDIYRASAIAHLRTMLFPDARRMAMLAMHPTADVMPESSLSAMISWSVEEFATGAHLAAATRDKVDVAGAIAFLGKCEVRREPVCIMGTTAAFAALFSALDSGGMKLRLASGSRMMDTGGAKGQAAPMPPSEVIARAGETLGIAPAMVINEYGMTELCSQLYDATSFNCAGVSDVQARFKIPPPWLRVTAVDPVTLRPMPDGEIGLLTFFDLANVGSVSAVMTEDLGAVERGRVRVIGRVTGGEVRGCALGIGQFSATEASRSSR
jgi:Acyl-protein synthetase, LuxE